MEHDDTTQADDQQSPEEFQEEVESDPSTANPGADPEDDAERVRGG